MIRDTDTIQVEVLVSGGKGKHEKYTSYCVESFRDDEIPCSYRCEGKNLGNIRQIKQIRARNAEREEISEGNDLWKTIQYGARHKLGHGRGLCKECKKLGITPQSTPTASSFRRKEELS